MTWLITFKPTFLNESLALPPKELAQVQKKLSLLAEDPRPDAKTKKQLKYWDGKLHRLRSGDYRIFYTFEEPYISVLALRRRDDDTYEEDLVAEKQLLESLLGDDAKRVDVRTTDAICLEIAREADLAYNFAPRPELLKLLKTAVANAVFYGNALQVAAQRRTIETLSPAYLLDEILSVIEARALASEQEYQAARRPGRLRTLGKSQRAAVWVVRQSLRALFTAQGKHTWEMARALAAELATTGRAPVQYDAVLIDEAQDLQPVALRVLVHLCKSPGTLFVTADANQSIYGSGFRWTEVHEDLRFQGRTALLRANHRSTRELGEAAHDYLQAGAVEESQAPERDYVNAGPLPAVRAVVDEAAELELLAQFCRGAAKALRLGLGACAILCPFKEDGERIAEGLRKAGLEARWTTADTLDLNNPGVKVLTLKSAKGLEFPVVALAGFLSGKYPYLPVDASDEEIQESLFVERRTMFVAMTRAMRALLVVTPKDVRTPLLQGFAPGYWNLGGS